MKFKCEKYLGTLIELSSIQTKEELIVKFISALENELSGSSVILYKIYLQRASDLKSNIPIGQNVIKPQEKKVLISSIPAFQTCYEQKQIINNAQEADFIYPIIDKTKVNYILHITNFPDSPGKLIITEKIITLFNNQIVLLNARDHDYLTDLLNRQALYRFISILYSSQYNPNYSYLGIMDIDHFKKINDNFGHVIGDEILLLISQYLKAIFRPEDIVARYGGEEFLVLLKEADIEDAYMIFERCRLHIEQSIFPRVDNVTISIGYCHFHLAEDFTTQIEKADKALYYAKENGRNQVCSYEILTIDKKVKQVPERTGDIIMLS